eukprot:1853323-Rhodomonas_salina.4
MTPGSSDTGLSGDVFALPSRPHTSRSRDTQERVSRTRCLPLFGSGVPTVRHAGRLRTRRRLGRSRNRCPCTVTGVGRAPGCFTILRQCLTSEAWGDTSGVTNLRLALVCLGVACLFWRPGSRFSFLCRNKCPSCHTQHAGEIEETASTNNSVPPRREDIRKLPPPPPPSAFLDLAVLSQFESLKDSSSCPFSL